MPTIEFSIQECKVTEFNGDVLGLKYAQAFHGVDRVIASSLTRRGIPIEKLQPQIDGYSLIETQNYIEARRVLFVGTPPLIDLDYSDIRLLSQRTLAILAKEAPHTQHLGMTIHGPGFGLDEAEAVLAQFAGYIEALQRRQFPQNLKKISIISNDLAEIERLRKIIDDNLSSATYASRSKGELWAYDLDIFLPTISNRGLKSTRAIDCAGQESLPKSRVFVAMPFKKDMEDIFYYGIQQPTHAVGFLCERIDQEAFTGDILEQMKKKIETATVVIAELSGANPNVYLEVGYAWGKGCPTVLLIKDEKELCFDVRGQKCLKYTSIKHLEEILKQELNKLKSQKMI